MEVCVILCGGKSSRMGQKKETLDFLGESLAEFQAKKMQKIFSQVYFSSKSPLLNPPNFPTILDSSTEFAPIFGLESILKTLQKDAFVLSVDAPFLAKESITKLINSYQKTQKPTFAKNQKIHPLLGIYPYKALDSIKHQIAQKNYRLRDLLGLIGADFVEIPHAQTQNLNTQEDYQNALQKHLKERSEGHFRECLEEHLEKGFLNG